MKLVWEQRTSASIIVCTKALNGSIGFVDFLSKRIHWFIAVIIYIRLIGFIEGR